MPDLTPTVCPRTGLLTWPEIVQYRIVEGRQKGTVLDYPPDRRIFPAPIEKDPATGREGRRPGSAAYELVIHDRDAYEALAGSGAIYSPRHTGRRSGLVDNQKAPGAYSYG